MSIDALDCPLTGRACYRHCALLDSCVERRAAMNRNRAEAEAVVGRLETQERVRENLAKLPPLEP